MIDSGAASSEREAAKIISKETGEPENTVRTRIQRGKKAMDSTESKPKHTNRGGARPNSGRPPQTPWQDHHNLYNEYLRCIKEEITEMANAPNGSNTKIAS